MDRGRCTPHTHLTVPLPCRYYCLRRQDYIQALWDRYPEFVDEDEELPVVYEPPWCATDEGTWQSSLPSIAIAWVRETRVSSEVM